MTDITKLTLKTQLDLIARKEITASELTAQYFKKIKEVNPILNAYLLTVEEQAMKKAKIADQNIMAGKAGILEGAAIGVKDNFCTSNVRTSCASHILENFVPTYESRVTENLWNSGALMLGKLNMDEFAMGSANMNSYFGKVVNPLQRAGDDAELVPGGSSGGSAAAVAGFLCSAAIGSDTGGSIRQPSSFTATVGLKPSYGRCSRWGLVAFASSLDQAGPITRDVYDSALMLEAISGFDNRDSTSIDVPREKFTDYIGGDIKGMRVGIPKEYQIDGMDSGIKSMWEEGAKTLKELGAELIDISLPHTSYAAPTYYIIATAECSSNLARFDGVRYGMRSKEEFANLAEMYFKTRGEGFGDEVKKRILTGTYVLSSGYYDAYYKKAQQVRRLITDDFNKAFEKVDVILTPTTPNAAFGTNEKLSTIEMYLNDVFTVSANLAGLPALSLPATKNKNGLPLGLQFIGKSFDEKTIFQAASAFEKAVNFDHTTLNYRF